MIKSGYFDLEDAILVVDKILEQNLLFRYFCHVLSKEHPLFYLVEGLKMHDGKRITVSG